MKQRPRIYYTETQKDLIWERWQKGESLHEFTLETSVLSLSLQPVAL